MILIIAKIIDTEVSIDDIVEILSRYESPKFQYLNPVLNRPNFKDKSFVFSDESTAKILDSIQKQGNFFIDGNNESMSGIDVLQDFVSKDSLKKLGNGYQLGEAFFFITEEEVNK